MNIETIKLLRKMTEQNLLLAQELRALLVEIEGSKSRVKRCDDPDCIICS